MYHPDQMYEQIKMRQEDIRNDEERRWQARQAQAGRENPIMRAVKSVVQRLGTTSADARTEGPSMLYATPVAPAQEGEC